MTMNYLFDKSTYIRAIKDFRACLRNKAFHPTRDIHGTVHQGTLNFSTFLFYAMLRGKDTASATHCTESRAYVDTMETLKEIGEGRDNYLTRPALRDLKACFAALSEDDIKATIRASFQ